ncbi:MAG: ChbG/HpnK family deacetylase [Caldilineaceae bacterium]
MVTSTTLMVTCPWAQHAMRFLAEHPEIPFGVHLTAVSDSMDYRWGPVSGSGGRPSLIDETGNFYNFEQVHRKDCTTQSARVGDEFRAQIETVRGRVAPHPPGLAFIAPTRQ